MYALVPLHIHTAAYMNHIYILVIYVIYILATISHIHTASSSFSLILCVGVCVCMCAYMFVSVHIWELSHTWKNRQSRWWCARVCFACARVCVQVREKQATRTNEVGGMHVCVYPRIYAYAPIRIWLIYDIYTLTHSQRNWREYAHVRVSVHLWLRERKGSSVRLGTHLGQLIKHHVRAHIDTTAHCNTLQRTATHCNALQHTATHCNTGGHMIFMRFASCTTLQHISCAYVRVRVSFVCVRAVRVPCMCACCARFASHCNTYRVRVCMCACARFLCVCACCACGNMCVCARAFHVHQLYTQPLQHTATHCNTLQHTATPNDVWRVRDMRVCINCTRACTRHNDANVLQCVLQLLQWDANHTHVIRYSVS